MIVKPSRLKRGDTVGIIAPASPPNRENLQRSLDFLADLGLKVKMGQHVEQINGYLAGSDNERIEDLHTMFKDDEIKAIICAGGGYGTARIADRIDYSLVAANPKIFWGYSDVTFLHQAFLKKTGLVTFHGPMLASDIGKEDVDELSKKLFAQLFVPGEFTYNEEISLLHTVVSGKASGQLIGGNLSLLTSTLGTQFELDTAGKLLLIEDVNEEPRAIDRMLNQLYMSGKLSQAAGIIIGDFANCVPTRNLSLSLVEVLDHYLKLANKPALSGFKIGHCSPNISIPLGVDATLDADKKEFIVSAGVE